VLAKPNVTSEECMPMQDDELLQLIAMGNQEALHTLYDRHSRLVFSLALHITADRLSAEDVTQDVFVLVWRCPTTFRSRVGTVQSWITAITRTCAIDTLRSGQGTARHQEIALDLADKGMPDERDTFESQPDLRDTLRHALGALPVSQRRAVALAYYGGCTTVEIAADLDVPVSTIKSQLGLALITLRAAVEQALEADQHGARGER
jgi:RNA polymerase sigma-70 factor (ECF subfamily)